ncbi:MAG: flippase [Nitrospirota bacterium]
MNEQRSEHSKKVSSGRVLAKNTMLNLIGQLVPMIVGVVTIPILIRHLGTDRFAVITIAWMLIGYFSLFDMGLGRALTQRIAEKIGNKKYEDIPGVFWTSMALMLAFSVVGASVIAVLCAPLVRNVLKVPSWLQSETLYALYIMAASVPLVIMTAALVGVLTAYHRFDIINIIRVPMGIYSYAAPVLILPFSNNLIPIVAALMLGRVINFAVHLFVCLKIEPDLRTNVVIQRSIIKPLLRFGGWLTVSNILNPFMVYFDRFLIGSLVSITAVAYYTTPYEFITKLWIIPGALLNVLFPAFASTYAEDRSRTAALFHRAVKYQLLAIFPVVFVIIAGAHQGFTLWLGNDFADNSYQVLQWLTIGVFINCLAQVPYSFLQGIGKPDITSKLHLYELLLYIPALWIMVRSYGITGAAIAWTGRVAIDTALLFHATRRSFQPLFSVSTSTGLSAIIATICLVCIVMLPEGSLTYAILAPALLAAMMAGWKIVLSGDERFYLLRKLSLIK